ncbi:MAG: hypothetical protein IKV83_02035 [Muribaculaceae bacterium]|nr:hypothetical protein [Muribaculaceae bacterium]
MKHLFTLILTLLLFTACGESWRNRQLLERAESIMNDSCEMALSILQDSIKPSTLTTERGRAIYAVLLSQALDKNYIDLTSDSIIAPAVDYFADGNESRYAMLTHYYHGKILLNQNNLSDAIISCSKAENLAKELNNDFYLGLIYGAIDDAYHRTNNHNESIKYAKLSYQHFNKINKQPHKKYAYFSLAISYNNNGDFDKSQAIYKELINSATCNCDTTFLVEVLESYSHLLWNNLKDTQAKFILKSLQSNFNHKLSVISLAHLADIYTKENSLDSASYFLNFAKPIAFSHNDSIAILIAEYNFNLANKNYDKALNLQQKQIEALNQSTKKIWEQSVMTLQRDYFESQAENATLEAKSQKHLNILIFIISIAILFTAVFIIYAQIMRNKAQKERINRILSEHYQSQNLISNAKKRIDNLEALLANETNKTQSLINELAIQKESLQIYTQQNKFREIAINTIESSEIVIRFREILDKNNNPTKEDWNKLDNYINLKFPGFKTVLYNLTKLSEIEYQVCMLLKSKFTPHEIASIINRSRFTMSSIRTRLYYKMFKEKGSTSEFDKFINSI